MYDRSEPIERRAFNKAVSFVVHCQSQDEVDYYWNKVSAGIERAAAG